VISTLAKESAKPAGKAKLSVCLLAAAAFSGLSVAPAVAQGGQITFEDVFANPDDKQLNIDYARQEANSGNLLAAAATLERMLIIDENWDDARLFYAAVLYRLGDYQGAEREVRILEARPLTPDLKAQLESFTARIRGKLKKSRLVGALSVGLTYEDNVAVNADDVAGGGGSAIATSDQPDQGLTARVRAKYSYELGGVQDAKFIAMFSSYSKLYEDFGQVDFNFLAGKVGFEGADGPFDWVVTLDYKNLDIAGDQYLSEYGLDMRIRRELTEKTSIQFDGDYSDQSYDNIVIGALPTQIEDLRSGLKYSGAVSLNHKFGAGVRGSVGVGLQTKKAEFEPYAYSTTFLTASGSKNFRNGAYAVASYFYRDVDYRESDPTIAGVGPEPRREDRHYARAAVGVPVGAIFDTGNENLQKTLDSVVVEASVFRDERQANFDIYDYDNTGAEVQLTWRFNR
jgi:hypothetical protein